MTRVASAVAVVCLILSILATAAKKPDEYADLSFTVLNEENDQPIRNAAIVLHEVDRQGRQANQGVELKTDSEGKSAFAGARYGKLRIQVIGRGFQTFGQDFVISEPKQEFTIKLKRPVRQYSIYDK
jgi:hypothetical protein